VRRIRRKLGNAEPAAMQGNVKNFYLSVSVSVSVSVLTASITR